MKFSLSENKIFVVLFLYVTLVLFVISPDSYTHDLFGRTDSAWFFMCGKAWMNGMVPYVDFTDSKGPLLWLIYGIGYLIHNYSYVGVFWLSCISYSFVFFFCFKIAFLLTNSSRTALIATLCMILPFFLNWFHYEIRAEDFCHPYTVCGLYFLIKSDLSPTKKTFRLAGISLGIGFAACFLIKWSIAVMIVSFIFSQAYIAIQRKFFKCFFVTLLLGVVLTFLPFMIYFLIDGNFFDFINEYFIVTTQTVSEPLSSLILTYIYEWIYTLSSNKLIYVLFLIGLISYYRKRKGNAIFPVICFCFYFCISIHHDMKYYTTILAPFAIFIIIDILKYLDKFYSVLFIAVVLCVQYQNVFRRSNIFYQNGPRESYYEIAYLMSQVKNPKIINEGYENGIGLPAQTLPATKYWSRQNGETKDMQKSRHDAIKEGKADFIVYSNKLENQQFMLEDSVFKAGYTFYGNFYVYPFHIKLYGRPGLKKAPESFSVSDADIFFKRKIF